ncbi:MAG: solute carrier protein [Monoraphidium minutum]|nr:MAG: solute carrier protein [Monoraphidium minutum]
MTQGDTEPLLAVSKKVGAHGEASGASAPQDIVCEREKNDRLLPLWVVLLYYTIASGTLLVINKVAIVQLPAPTFILLCQLITSAAAVLVAHWAGAVTVARATPRQLWHFVPVVAGFIGTIYANMKVLQHSNVETFITFRSSTPLLLSFLDWALLGRRLPTGRSWAALAGLLASSAGYAFFDQGFVVDAYVWLAVWYAFFTFEGVWVKHMCDTVPMSNWARVYYANLMSSPVLLAVFLAAKKEQALLAAASWGPRVAGPLALSCAMGVAMSHASYLLRSHAAATTAAVVGIVCKLVSVALNVVIWDRHAGPLQIGFLLMGILAAAMYRQAPLRDDAKEMAKLKASDKDGPTARGNN